MFTTRNELFFSFKKLDLERKCLFDSTELEDMNLLLQKFFEGLLRGEGHCPYGQ